MIKVNLALKKQSAASAGETKTGSGLARFTRADLSSLQGLPIRRLVLGIAVCYLANYVLEDYKAMEIEKMDAAVAQVTAEQSKLTEQVNASRDNQKLKEQFEADEIALQNKIDTIQKLMGGRKDSTRMLIALSQTIPNDVWITQFNAKEDLIEIQGGAKDYGLISDFMQKLGESAHYRDLTLKSTDQEQSGAGTATFELVAKRN